MNWQEFWSEGLPSDNMRILAAILLLIISILGGVFNTMVIMSLLLRVKRKDGFLKICLTKSVGNDIVCIGYLIWPVPVTFANNYFLPHFFNAFMGQLVGWFGWSITPLTQVLLTSNRMMAVYFPGYYTRNYPISPSTIGLAICLFLCFLLFAAFFPEGCHYLYVLEDIGWLPEESVCTQIRRTIFIYSMIFIVTSLSICGIAMFLKLVYDTKAVMLSTVESTSRKSKHQKMLIQTLIQNFLILADTLNTTVTYKLCPVLMFQFLTLSFSMVFLRALEGLVMISMNDRIWKGVKNLLGVKEELQSLRVQPSIWNVSSTAKY